MTASARRDDDMREPGTDGARPERPRAVSFVASVVLAESLVLLVLGGLGLIGQVVAFQTGLFLADPFWPLTEMLQGLAVAITLLAIGAILLLAGIGLLRMHEWAWILAMTVQGASLAGALYGYVNGRAPYAALALGSFVVLVLNQREVRHAFIRADERA